MGSGGGIAFPKVGTGLKAVVAANVGAYILYLVALRLNLGFTAVLPLVPKEFFTDFYLWQPVTSVLIHSPSSVGHLLLNMLFLWMMGGQVERWWGTGGFIRAYVISGLMGAALTLLAALIVLPMGPAGPLYYLWQTQTMGASGAVYGVIAAALAVQWNSSINLFLVGPVKGKHVLAFFVFIQFLTALSFDNSSVTSHLGGMLVGFLMGRGYLRQDRLSPKRLRLWWTDRKVQREVARREAERKQRMARFEVLDGGKDGADDVAGKPIYRYDDDDDPVVH